MPTDLLALLQRDHQDLVAGLDALLCPDASLAEIRTSLDGVRLGLAAHTEAEDIVLYGVAHRCRPEVATLLGGLVAEVRTAHAAQEAALGALVCTPPASPAWFDRARHLRDLVCDHASYEELQVIPLFHALAPTIYPALAGAFATERLCQLAMLQPSAVFEVPELAVGP